MKDKLIDIETAKLAREKGFTEHCDYLYFKTGELSQIGNYNNIEVEMFESYSAPTQSLLAKWLREEQNLEISIEKLIGGGTGLSHVYSWNVYRVSDSEGIPSFDIPGDYVYDSYEQALEKALLKALELIEN